MLLQQPQHRGFDKLLTQNSISQKAERSIYKSQNSNSFYGTTKIPLEIDFKIEKPLIYGGQTIEQLKIKQEILQKKLQNIFQDDEDSGTQKQQVPQTTNNLLPPQRILHSTSLAFSNMNQKQTYHNSSLPIAIDFDICPKEEESECSSEKKPLEYQYQQKQQESHRYSIKNPLSSGIYKLETNLSQQKYQGHSLDKMRDENKQNNMQLQQQQQQNDEVVRFQLQIISNDNHKQMVSQQQQLEQVANSQNQTNNNNKSKTSQLFNIYDSTEVALADLYNQKQREIKSSFVAESSIKKRIHTTSVDKSDSEIKKTTKKWVRAESQSSLSNANQITEMTIQKNQEDSNNNELSQNINSNLFRERKCISARKERYDKADQEEEKREKLNKHSNHEIKQPQTRSRSYENYNKTDNNIKKIDSLNTKLEKNKKEKLIPESLITEAEPPQAAAVVSATAGIIEDKQKQISYINKAFGYFKQTVSQQNKVKDKNNKDVSFTHSKNALKIKQQQQQQINKKKIQSKQELSINKNNAQEIATNQIVNHHPIKQSNQKIILQQEIENQAHRKVDKKEDTKITNYQQTLKQDHKENAKVAYFQLKSKNSKNQQKCKNSLNRNYDIKTQKCAIVHSQQPQQFLPPPQQELITFCDEEEELVNLQNQQKPNNLINDMEGVFKLFLMLCGSNNEDMIINAERIDLSQISTELLLIIEDILLEIEDMKKDINFETFCLLVIQKRKYILIQQHFQQQYQINNNHNEILSLSSQQQQQQLDYSPPTITENKMWNNEQVQQMNGFQINQEYELVNSPQIRQMQHIYKNNNRKYHKNIINDEELQFYDYSNQENQVDNKYQSIQEQQYLNNKNQNLQIQFSPAFGQDG